MVSQFTKTFILKDLRDHRQKVLFDREQALLHQTQLLVERQIETEKIQNEITELELEYRIKRNILIKKRDNLITGSTKTERAQFVRACPDENCRGFLSSQWKCGICEKWSCPDCHEVKGMTRDIEHTCKSENLETAKLLDKDTKPCPSCGTGIFKIGGCDQMWCTLCHTAFSWKNGIKETTHNHNPHYYEWLRRTGGNIVRDPNDIQCGMEVNDNFVRDIMEVIVNILNCRDPTDQITSYNDRRLNQQKTMKFIKRIHSLNYDINSLTSICQNIIHIRTVDIRNDDQDQLYNEKLRIDYLRNRITKENFQKKIEQKNKKTEKNRETNNIIRMLVTTTIDILFRLKDSLRKYDKKTTPNNLKFIDDCFSIFNEIDAIVSYSNECFEDVGKTYNSKPLRINSFRNINALHNCKKGEHLLYRNTVEYSEIIYTGVKVDDPPSKEIRVGVCIPEMLKDNNFQLLADGNLLKVKSLNKNPGDLIYIKFNIPEPL
jgi:hypothetical protein